MKWHERIKKLLAEKNLTPKELGERTGLGKRVYGYVNPTPGREIENPRGDVLEKIARSLGVTEQYLRFGDAVANLAHTHIAPVLDMNKVGTLKPKADPMSVWDKASVVRVDANLSTSCFALRVVGDVGTPVFEEGEMVVCDPDQEITPGCWVVAVLDDEERAVIAKWKPAVHGDKKNFTLTVGNPDYPPIVVGSKGVRAHVIARVVQHHRNL
jgi:SOS-response transcriptional repressor LexA